MAIQSKPAIVYLAPTAGKRFLTKRGAIQAEARAIIKKHFPDERPCPCTPERCGMCRDPGWSLETDQPERYQRYYLKLMAALRRTIDG